MALDTMPVARASAYWNSSIVHQRQGNISAALPLAQKAVALLDQSHDARNMALSAELFYRTALTRRESRGWFIREDYPERDNGAWLKWINAEPDGGEMRIWTEDVPVSSYPFKPGDGQEGGGRDA